jgi:hypothetical protein
MVGSLVEGGVRNTENNQSDRGPRAGGSFAGQRSLGANTSP